MIEISKKCLTIAVVFVLAGCAAMEGTNVGVNVPIGGVVNVGANKTIGERQTPAKTRSNTTEDSEESESDSEEE